MRVAALLVALFSLTLTFAAVAREDDGEKARTVTIKDLRYEPAKISIKVGQSVTWINKDDNDHTVVADGDDDAFDSDNLGNGEKFKHTFKKAGKFKYHCRYHPRMKGEITVAE
jgi:plastocyanin